MTSRRIRADKRLAPGSTPARRLLQVAPRPGAALGTEEDNHGGHARSVDERHQVELKAAIHRNRLGLELAPIYDLASDRFVGVDTVVDGGRRGLASIGVPSPLRGRGLLRSVEARDLLVAANTWLVERAISSLSRVEDQLNMGQTGGQVHVTVMLDDRFIADESFLPTVKNAVRRAGVEPRQLLLSVDPDIGFESLWPNLQRLKSHGVRVAFEGDVIGPPATELLRRFPFDVIRIDPMSFSAGQDLPDRDRRRNQTVASSDLDALVELAQSLRCRIMIDGLETAQAVRTMRVAGCSEGTGRALGPLPVRSTQGLAG
ncbi:MAG: EAL domain-containing protein [Actinomycetia bacterium]|nr:EAL domain-containing protein [Actinomycetes bacterium]